MKKLIALALIGFLATAHAQQAPNFGGAMVPNGGPSSGSGSVTSVAAGCGATANPSPITSTGTLSAALTSRTNTGTTDTILSTDCGNIVYENNSAGVAVALPAPSGAFASGFFTTICNINGAIDPITPGSGNIGGDSPYNLPAGANGAPTCITVSSDGTNYHVVPAPGQLGGQPGYIVNNWYRAKGIVGIQNGTAVLPGNVVSCYYGTIPRTVTIQAVGYRLQTASASGNFTIALYTNANGRPASLITSIGSQSTTTTGTFSVALASNKQVGPGGIAGGSDIWFCANADNSNTVYETPTQVTQDAYIGDITLANFTGTTATPWGISCNGATACGGATSSFSAGTYTWPSSLASGSTWTTMTGSGIPIIWFEAVSSP